MGITLPSLQPLVFLWHRVIRVHVPMYIDSITLCWLEESSNLFKLGTLAGFKVAQKPAVLFWISIFML